MLQQRAEDTEQVARAKELLKQIDTPEKATALTGPAREAYLAALDTIYGERAKRAQDQGFGPTMYHGSTSTGIDAFDPGRTTDSGTLGKGVYTTPDAELASSYTGDGATYPVRIRGEVVDGRATKLTAEQKSAIQQ